MDEKKLNQLNEYLKSMDLPFQYPLVEALIREDLASGRGEKAADICTRIYNLAGSVPPGEDASLLFEQYIFDLFREQTENFDKDDDELVAPMRGRLMTLLDRWTQLSDFLAEEKQAGLKGREEVQRELDELLTFSNGLLDRVNHPADETGESLGELDFLIQQSEEVLIRIMEKIDELLHPPVEKEAADAPDTVLTLKVSIPGLARPVWRRIRVSGQITLSQFHYVLQKTMGWWDLYGHQFEQAGRFWTPGGDEEKKSEDEGRCVLSSLLEEEDDLLHYHYDLSEDWHHKIYVEGVEELSAAKDESASYVLECLAGEGACPPEDCGGPEGYRMLLASLKEDASEDLKDDFAWVGDYDPEGFSLEGVNKELKALL